MEHKEETDEEMVIGTIGDYLEKNAIYGGVDFSRFVCELVDLCVGYRNICSSKDEFRGFARGLKRKVRVLEEEFGERYSKKFELRSFYDAAVTAAMIPEIGRLNNYLNDLQGLFGSASAKSGVVCDQAIGFLMA